MSVVIKSPTQIEQMRTAGRLAAEVLELIAPHVRAGISTGELDRICHEHIVNVQRAVPAPLHYGGGGGRPAFPKSICTSINHVVCHGIPSDSKLLKRGDVINIDITVIKNGWHGDTSAMFTVGETAPFTERLIRVTQECLYKAIALVRPGIRLGDLGHVIQQHAEANRFSVVRDYCGHGIGEGFHEDPQIVHYGRPDTGLIIEEGMTFTIEPMINAGTHHTRLLPDGWTVVTRDHKLSAQWEHTLAVTATGCEVLTARRDESF